MHADEKYIKVWPSFPCFLFLAAPGQQIEASENPLPVGSNVTLFSPQDNFTTGAWIFNNNIILLIFNGNPVIFTAWINRITFNSTLSSLTINSVQLEDSGLYTLQGVNSFSSQLELSVQGKNRFITFHVYSLIYIFSYVPFLYIK